MSDLLPIAISGNKPQSMTLKEITDLLDVRHNDAMKVASKMAESPEFGELRKFRTSYLNNIGAEISIDTYLLNYRQSMAVSARLNTALLMRVIDRWHELESQQHKLPDFTNPAIAAKAYLDVAESYNNTLLLLQEKEQVILSLEQICKQIYIKTCIIFKQQLPFSRTTKNSVLDWSPASRRHWPHKCGFFMSIALVSSLWWADV